MQTERAVAFGLDVGELLKCWLSILGIGREI